MKKVIHLILMFVLACSLIGCTAISPSTTSERLGEYPQTDCFLGGMMIASNEYVRWKEQYETLSREEQILYCIDQLQNEEYSPSSFGRILPEGTYTDAPETSPSAELIRIGKDAIPHLIAALDRQEKTRIITWRWFTEPWLVQDAALDVIQRIACREFSDAIHSSGPEKSYLAALSEDEHNGLRATIQAWWELNKDTDEVSWAETALMSDQKEDWWYRSWAAHSLYARIGAKSYPILIRAYERIPKGSDKYDHRDSATSQKENILDILEKEASTGQRGFLLQVLADKPFSLRLEAARCLWAMQDQSGLNRILKETEEKILPGWGDGWLRDHSDNLIGFFSLCGTQDAKEMIVKCLDGRNPYLRKSAVYRVPDLKMEKAVRKLPELFDDPFVIGGSYQSTKGDRTVTVPPRQIRDAAAEAFNKTVPESPLFGGKSDEEQEQSIRIIDEWWQVNQNVLVWNKKRGILELKEKSNH